jgi:AcrR family transcriptional regulator
MTERGVRRRTGRRPGSQPTRQEIVDAARELFATRGYRSTTIRAIAAAAGVDPALVHRFFGSKENLFAATLEFPEQAAPNVLAALHGDQADIGERLTRAYLNLWEDATSREQMKILTMSALTNTEAMTPVRAAIGRVLGQLRTTDITGPDPEVRFQLAMGHLLGVACVRHLTRVPPLSDLPFEDLVARVAPAIQSHLSAT